MRESTKDKVLKLLSDHNSNFVSGQEIADTLYITRAGIWKAVNALRKEGYNIEAVTNKGYRLMKNTEVPDPSAIESALQAAGIRIKVFYMEESLHFHLVLV